MLEEIWGAVGWKRKINRNGDSQTKYRAIAKVVFTINKLQMGQRHFHLDHLFGLPHLLSLRTSGRGNARMSTPWVQVAFSSFLFRRFSLAVLRCSKGMRELQAWSRGNPHQWDEYTRWSEYILCGPSLYSASKTPEAAVGLRLLSRHMGSF